MSSINNRLRQSRDMGGADLATAADDGGTLFNPAQREMGIGIGPQITARGQRIDRGLAFRKSLVIWVNPLA